MDEKQILYKALDRFEGISSSELERMFNVTSSNKIPLGRPFFILPRGNILDVREAINGDESTIHDDLTKSFIEKFLEVNYPDEDLASVLDRYEYSIQDKFETNIIDVKGWCHCNTGTESVDERFYCILPDGNAAQVTNSQYYTLEDFFDVAIQKNVEEVTIFIGADSIDIKIRGTAVETEDIINTIRRYYSTGSLEWIDESIALTEVYPTKGENKEDFISRFMKETKYEYPDRKQRYAIALSYWNRRKKNESVEDTSWQEYFTNEKTGFPFYDQYLDPKEKQYLLKKYNREGKVEYMEPKRYLQMVAEMFGTPYSRQYLVGTEESSQSYFDELVSKGEKLWMPYISMADGAQEGRHRAVWAMEHGLNKIPVLVISVADEREERKRKAEENRRDIEKKILSAINDATLYHYSNLDGFKYQMEWRLSKEFEEEVTEDMFEMKEFSPTEYSITFKGVEVPFDRDAIMFRDDDELDDDELDIDELDIDELGIDDIV